MACALTVPKYTINHLDKVVTITSKHGKRAPSSSLFTVLQRGLLTSWLERMCLTWKLLQSGGKGMTANPGRAFGRLEGSLSCSTWTCRPDQRKTLPHNDARLGAGG